MSSIISPIRAPSGCACDTCEATTRNCVFVTATRISQRKKEVEFQCPFCWTAYDKYDEPAKRARRKVHTHKVESMDPLCNVAFIVTSQHVADRVLIRTPHCGGGRFPQDKIAFAIQVTTNTYRDP